MRPGSVPVTAYGGPTSVAYTLTSSDGLMNGPIFCFRVYDLILDQAHMSLASTVIYWCKGLNVSHKNSVHAIICYRPSLLAFRPCHYRSEPPIVSQKQSSSNCDESVECELWSLNPVLSSLTVFDRRDKQTFGGCHLLSSCHSTHQT